MDERMEEKKASAHFSSIASSIDDEFVAVNAGAEKSAAALASVFAGVFLLVLKLAAGIWTNSLGLLADAAHSGLDFVAAFVTYLAVRAADKPADEKHQYGHGKIENLAAAFETLLLAATAFWILWEAWERIAGEAQEISHGFVGIGVIFIAISVDFFRVRDLKRVAKKHRSQALEADALHFSSDIWTSLAVLFGLAYAQAARLWGWPAAALMDSLAAVAVALLVLCVSFRMGRRACSALLDASPELLGPILTDAVRGIKGVSDPVRVRTRRAGGHLFVDVRAALDRRLPLEEACRISRRLEETVRKTAGEPVDFLLHAESFVSSDESLTAKVRHAARMEGVTAHNIKLLLGAERIAADLHLEVEGDTPLEDAHALAHRIERRVREEDAGAGEIVIHLEPLRDPHADVCPANTEEIAECVQICEEAVATIPGIKGCENIKIVSAGIEEQRHLHLTAHVLITLPATVCEAHRRCEKMEDFLRERLPRVRRITLHAEPEISAAPTAPQN